MGITPNRITASRLVLAPVALFFQQLGGGWLSFCLLAIICAEVSDAVDGYLARRWKMQTPFGKLFDPMADTGFHLTLFCGFIGSGWMPWWFLPIFYWRDLLSSILRTYVAAEHREAMAARLSGKFKTASQGTVQIATVALYWLVPLFFEQQTIPLYRICVGLMAASLIITFISAIDYGYDAYVISLKKKTATEPPSSIPV